MLKDAFYAKLEDVYGKRPAYGTKIVRGGFIVEVGQAPLSDSSAAKLTLPLMVWGWLFAVCCSLWMFAAVCVAEALIAHISLKIKTMQPLQSLYCVKYLMANFVSRKYDVNCQRWTCNLTTLDNFLWGAIKEKFYADKPEAIKHLKAIIRYDIAGKKVCQWMK